MSYLSSHESFSILTPVGMLGYGYDLSHFWHAINEHKPAACIADAGSTDPGPCLLGTGQTLCSRSSIRRDMEPMLEACFHRGIKVLISSCGGAGLDAQVDDFVSIIQEIAEDNQWTFKVGAVYSKVDKSTVLAKLEEGKVTPCGEGPPELRSVDVEKSGNIVAQIGAEPFMELLKDSSIDVIVSGRSYDPAPFAAFSMHMGCEPATAWHVGKIIECGALCALPKGKCIVATMRKDNFDLTPVNPIERCTPLSVAAHQLYEKTKADQLPGPGGILHMPSAIYKQLSDDRTVRVSSAEFVSSPRYQVKLEGAEQLGYRAVFIGGIRDPILIDHIDQFLDQCSSNTAKTAYPQLLKDPEHYQLIFHVMGRNGVMGPLETSKQIPHEIAILGEALAPTQEEATSMAGFSRVQVLHGEYPGQMATAGNFALPLNPLESPIGPVFNFSIYHLMDIDGEQASMFRRSITSVGPTTRSSKGVVSSASANYKPLKAATLGPIAKKNVPNGPTPLKDIATIIRSKNAGPFTLTFDVLFDDVRSYERVQKSGVLDNSVVMKMYNIKNEKDIVTNTFFKPALAWKCTIIRPWLQGSIGERDTFGTQQHVPLMYIEVP